MNKYSLLIIFYLLFFSQTFCAVYAAPPKNLGVIDSIGRFGIKPNAGDINVEPFSKNLEGIISMIIGFLTIYAGVFFMINFIVGGISWSTAGGDSNKIESAKKRMTNGALGLIIVVASYSIIYIIGSVLGLDILRLSKTITDNFK